MLLLALVCACSLASGHRIQPSALSNRHRRQALKVGQTSPAAEAAPAAAAADEAKANSSEPRQQAASQPVEAKTQSAELQPQAASQPADAKALSSELEQVASVIEEHGWPILEKMKTFMYYNAKDSMNVAQHYLHNAPRPVMGIVLGSGFVVASCVAFCIAQLLSSLLPRKRKRFQHSHEGRVVYEWDQTPKVATLYIRPPEGVTKNDLDIRIACRHLRVGRKGKPSFLREETYDVVNEEMSSWSLRSNGELQIYLQKARRAEWPTILLHNSEKFPIPALSAKLKLPISWTRQQEKPFYA